MSLCRSILRAAGCLVLAAAPASAATLVHEYALRGTLNDSQGGPALASLGGQITALGYVFAANQGLTLSSAALSATSFSLEFSFRFDTTAGYRKIVDFHDRTSDGGLYQLNGALNFYPIASAGQADFSPGVDVHVVLTRDGATGIVVGYVNGQQRFTFQDSTAATITAPQNRLNFFVDDNAVSGEASGGTVNYLRVYNGALTAGEVSASFAAGAPLAIPEPSTVALLVVGAGLALTGAGRFRRRALTSIGGCAAGGIASIPDATRATPPPSHPSRS